MKILIVDDEIGIRTVIKEYCEDNNYQTDEAESGKQALNKLKVNDYDFALIFLSLSSTSSFVSTTSFSAVQ